VRARTHEQVRRGADCRHKERRLLILLDAQPLRQQLRCRLDARQRLQHVHHRGGKEALQRVLKQLLIADVAA
jgi:hypothetical protein